MNSPRRQLVLPWPPRATVRTMLLAALILSEGCTQQPQSSAVIAQVGNTALTVEDLRSLVPDEVLKGASQSELVEYVNQWMRTELLFQAAQAMGYGRDPRVEHRVMEARRDLMVDVFLEDELDIEPLISEEEIASFYENNLASFTRSETEVQAAILWFEDADHAEQARRSLNGGMSLAEVVADSSCGVVASDLESQYLSRLEFGEGLGDAVFGVRAGTVSRPIHMGDAYILIRVIDRKEAGTVRSLQVVRDEIVMRLASDLWEMKLDEMLARLLEQTDVSINVEAGLEALGRERLP